MPDIVIPLKFNVLDFNKYKGTTCPKSHLKMYYRKMEAYSRDEKLLMHFFQESLAGAAVTWYTNLEASQIRSWKDLILPSSGNINTILTWLLTEPRCKI